MELQDLIVAPSGGFTVRLQTPKNVWQWLPNGAYTYNGTQVLAARQTGWTAGTGTPNKGAFAADSATAVQAAQRCLAIEQVLRTHGLIN